MLNEETITTLTEAENERLKEMKYIYDAVLFEMRHIINTAHARTLPERMEKARELRKQQEQVIAEWFGKRKANIDALADGVIRE